FSELHHPAPSAPPAPLSKNGAVRTSRAGRSFVFIPIIFTFMDGCRLTARKRGKRNKNRKQMKWFKIISLAVVVTAAALASTGFINLKLLKKANADAKGFAVVELFTSEGCSSCPPADDLVAKIEKETAGTPVYILAYHVDYWNRLGWKDAYSSADFSKRQNEYARYLHIQSVYTPQIVVNGKTEFVGSQEGTLRNVIRAGLQKAAEGALSLSVVKSDKNEVSVKYTAEGADKNSVLLIALVQKHAQTKVMRGENAGHTLSHVQIVNK